MLSDVKGCADAGSAPKAKFVFRYGGCLANPKKGNWTLCNALDGFHRNVAHNCDLKEPGGLSGKAKPTERMANFVACENDKFKRLETFQYLILTGKSPLIS